MNVSGQRVQQLFNDLDRRFKYADKKGQSGVRGQEGDGAQRQGQQNTEDLLTPQPSLILALDLFH